MSLLEEVTQRMIDAHVTLSEDALREALGKWVSEIEPEVVRRGDGSMIGLGPIDHGNPIVPIRGVDVYLTYDGKRM